MNSSRAGTMLKTDIKIALHSLGRDYHGATKGKTLAELREMLAELRKEQLAAGIIKGRAAA